MTVQKMSKALVERRFSKLSAHFHAIPVFIEWIGARMCRICLSSTGSAHLDKICAIGNRVFKRTSFLHKLFVCNLWPTRRQGRNE